MSTRMITDELLGKTAMNQGGYPLGTVDDFVIDTETGEVKYILVKLGSSVRPGQQMDDKGRGVYSFVSLKVTGNNVIIS